MKKLLAGLLLGFGLLNAVAFMHAWRFTHFSTEAGTHSPNPEQLTAGQKLSLLLTGIRNPRPQTGPGPDFPFVALRIASPNGPPAAWYTQPGSTPARSTVALFHGYARDKSRLLPDGLGPPPLPATLPPAATAPADGRAGGGWRGWRAASKPGGPPAGR